TREYFIGSLVMVGDDKDSKLEIVDGQQRLTTITILLSALVEAFKSAGEHNLAQGVYSYIEARNLMNEPYFRLITKTSEPFFQSAVQHLNKESRTPNNQE
ncbi:GmrSD restriction endonuclease domain-containing protein, partial [Bacillus cereus]